MKTLILLLMYILIENNAIAQTGNIKEHLCMLPKNLELDNSSPRSYRMTTEYFYYNMKGDFLNKKRVTGTITYGLENNQVQWNNVYVSDSNISDKEFPEGENKDFMQNFSYLPGKEILTTEFFKDQLPQADPLIMNLIWDALCFDVMAYSCWDSLKLNKEFHASDLNSKIEMANIGTFENKDIRITWIGITEINNKQCAILKYSLLNNPLKVEWKNVSMTGRSHYWGEVYVSLTDKQIEYANLTEDVLTDMTIQGEADKIVGYTVRTIDLSRIKQVTGLEK